MRMTRRTLVTATGALLALAVVVGTLVQRGSAASAHGRTVAAGADGPPSEAQVWQTLNDPKRSGLDPATATRLADLGSRLVEADITGAGRDAFPGYWGDGAYRPCCRAGTIHAAGARRSGVHPGFVDVTVVWSAQRLNGGAPLTNQVETVTFEPVAGGWRPLPPR
jgi:hypothetical protein